MTHPFFFFFFVGVVFLNFKILNLILDLFGGQKWMRDCYVHSWAIFQGHGMLLLPKV
jgi:hypothetical protein